MNVEIGTQAAQFPFWEYINGIFVAMCECVGQEGQFTTSTKTSYLNGIDNFFVCGRPSFMVPMI
jgi:hypothetical protein